MEKLYVSELRKNLIYYDIQEQIDYACQEFGITTRRN